MLQIISLEKLKIYKKKNVRRYTYILYYLLYLINKIFFLKRCYFFGTHIDRQLSCIKFRKRYTVFEKIFCKFQQHSFGFRKICQARSN